MDQINKRAKLNHLVLGTANFCLIGMSLLLMKPEYADAALGNRPSQTELQSNTGVGVQQVCARLSSENTANPGSLNATQTELFNVCRSMVQSANDLDNQGPTGESRGLSESELNGSLQNISTEEIQLPGTMTSRTANSSIISLVGRMEQLRAGITGFTIAGLTKDQQPRTFSFAELGVKDWDNGGRGGAAGDDNTADWSKLGGFFNGFGTFGTKDATVQENGFDYYTAGFTAGIDYRFTDNIVAGIAAGYAHLDSDFEKSINVSGGSITGDGYGISGYGLYYLDSFYFDALIGFGQNFYDQKRRIVIPSNSTSPTAAPVDATANSKPDSSQYFFGFGLGYEVSEGPLTYGPFGRINYVQADVDGYTESGAGALDLQVSDQEIKSLVSNLGGQISYALSRGFGVLVPTLRADWRHEFKNDARTINSRYVNEFIPVGGAPTPLLTTSEGPDRDYGTVGIGVSGVFKGGLQGFFMYERWFELRDISVNLLTAGVRWEF